MWPFTQKGGLSKFHAEAIFTVLAVKWRNIIGMWVIFLQHTVNTPWKELLPPWNISRREKVHRIYEIFHGVEKIHSLREHHSATVNVIVLLNHATYRGAFQWFSESIIETWKSFKIDAIGSKDQVLTATQVFAIAFLCQKTHNFSLLLSCYRTVFHLRKRNRVFAGLFFAWQT